MAPNLAASQHALIRDTILAGYKNAVIARTANCRASLVRRIRANMRCYGSTKAPLNGVGRRRLLSPRSPRKFPWVCERATSSFKEWQSRRVKGNRPPGE
ncbi:hypothetical protein H9L39_04050 [Fusarium oxysporum f. sp. albedinis]|nr:hypothetical protein H9L39_04045 [Fusarium oxysporum f. sp. albedinis]KAK2486070.1 hypothetical protein H9L39_04050 [Fusarium oxysporum f. sp. albedinis]